MEKLLTMDMVIHLIYWFSFAGCYCCCRLAQMFLIHLYEAACFSITRCGALPVNNDPSVIVNRYMAATGQCFLQVQKTKGVQPSHVRWALWQRMH